MVGLIRMDFYRGGVLNIITVPKAEAAKKREELSQLGWVLAWSVEL